MNTNINDVRKRGYPDLQLVSEMANGADSLSQISEKVYEDVKTKEAVVTDANVEKARKASLIIAKMLTKYSARSSSSVAQVFQGADTDTPIDAQAKTFDTLLSELQGAMTSPQQKSLYDDISAKWTFIKNSYINYNENNVSFVINRYSLGIVDGLENLIASLSGKPLPASAPPATSKAPETKAPTRKKPAQS